MTEQVASGSSEPQISNPTPSEEAPKGEASPESKSAPESTPDPSESKSAVKERLFKVKIDGNELEVTESELMKGYALAKASNERFEKAAAERKAAEQLKKDVEARKERLKKDPWAVLEELGVNVREEAENYLIKQLNFDALSPEQKKALELEKKLKEYEDKEAAAKTEAEEKARREEEEKRKEEINALSQEYAKDYEAQFLEALQSTSLPRSPATVAKVAEKLHSALEQGYEMSVKNAVKLVEQEQKAFISTILKDADPDAIAALLGEDAVKKLRKRDVEKLKNPTPVADKAVEAPAPKSDTKPMSPDEWLKSIKRQHGILK